MIACIDYMGESIEGYTLIFKSSGRGCKQPKRRTRKSAGKTLKLTSARTVPELR